MVAAKKDTKDSSAEVKALKAELEKTRKALAEALEQIEKLKEKETGKPAAQPKEKTSKVDMESLVAYKRRAKEDESAEVEDVEDSSCDEPKDGDEYVDLGLSVKWATCNVGASKPEEYGDYFAWGETSTKEKYYEDNCPTYRLSYTELESQGYLRPWPWSSYHHLSRLSLLQRRRRSKIMYGNLTSQYDAACANWGGNWRMPTRAEMQELIDNCTWELTTQNGVKGYKVTGPNGNSIFLPAAGFRGRSSLYFAGSRGYYWSSTPSSLTNSAFPLYFDSDDRIMNYSDRYHGRSVRPVLE